jgi:Protein of unknown function (DUF3499)
MNASCVRCQDRASCLLAYDHAAAEAYLVDAVADNQRYQGMWLCEDHARRFVAPRGWSLIDERQPMTVLFDEREAV